MGEKGRRPGRLPLPPPWEGGGEQDPVQEAKKKRKGGAKPFPDRTPIPLSFPPRLLFVRGKDTETENLLKRKGANLFVNGSWGKGKEKRTKKDPKERKEKEKDGGGGKGEKGGKKEKGRKGELTFPFFAN